MGIVIVKTGRGQIHKAYQNDQTGRILVDEACNLDDATDVKVTTPGEIEDAPQERFCKRDFPEAWASGPI